jgi:hypothetical protein
MYAGANKFSMKPKMQGEYDKVLGICHRTSGKEKAGRPVWMACPLCGG